MKIKIMRKIGLLSIILILVSDVFATEIQQINQAGIYFGKILSTSYCEMGFGDKRYCKEFIIETDDGELLSSTYWLGDIYHAHGGIIFSYNPNLSNAERNNGADTAIQTYLPKNTSIQLWVQCSGDSGCTISKIKIL